MIGAVCVWINHAILRQEEDSPWRNVECAVFCVVAGVSWRARRRGRRRSDEERCLIKLATYAPPRLRNQGVGTFAMTRAFVCVVCGDCTSANFLAHLNECAESLSSPVALHAAQ